MAEPESQNPDEIWNRAIQAAADTAYSALKPFGSPLGWGRAERKQAQMAADAGNAVMRLLRPTEPKD